MRSQKRHTAQKLADLMKKLAKLVQDRQGVDMCQKIAKSVAQIANVKEFAERNGGREARGGGGRPEDPLGRGLWYQLWLEVETLFAAAVGEGIGGAAEYLKA